MHIPKPTINRSRLGDMVNEVKIDLRCRLDHLRGYPALLDMAERRLGYRPNLADPKTYNEKVIWRKLNDRNPLHPILSDKLRVRDEILRRLGPETGRNVLTEVYDTTADADGYDFTRLPPSYVAKANHASGWNIFVKPDDPLDEARMRLEMRRWLRRSYGKLKHEWAYQEVPRRVMFEEYVTQPDGRVPDDLKFMFFHGECQFVLWDDDRFGTWAQHYIRPDWAPYGFSSLELVKRDLPPKPKLYDEMLRLASVMAKDLDNVRVDFLFTEDRILLNEMTLYRGSGMNPFDPPEWDRHFGDLWTLPKV
ncbi:ATP-grasp fold amidoligase family protein [Pseudaestuariivita sp.]|uniref:ATP-grasp fold amidoligase family protein n=1 Tax=Pseudaestuariivita sp. TaxID=2211669 RepID=UPI004059197C